MISWLGGSLIQWACCVAVSLPFVVLAARSTKITSWRRVFGLALFFFITLALSRLEPIPPFTKQLWQTMTLQAVWAGAVILAAGTLSEFGLSLRISPLAWRDALLAIGLTLLFVVVRQLALRAVGSSGGGAVGAEFLLYQATMPGIAEELVYRGVIQSSLNRVFGRPYKLLRAPVGWGWVITSILFWAIHAFRVDNQVNLSFYWPTFTMQFVISFVLGWLRERTDSIAPAVLAHNLVNVVWSCL